MRQHLIGRQPGRLFGVEHGGDESLGRLAHLRPVAVVKVEAACEDLVKEEVLVVLLIGEGRVAAEEDEGNDARRPDVHRVGVANLQEDLRRDVGGRAANGEEQLVGENFSGKAKVGQLDCLAVATAGRSNDAVAAAARNSSSC